MISFFAYPHYVYYFGISGYQSNIGSYTFNVSCRTITPSPTQSPIQTDFIHCGDTITGSTSLPYNFEDRYKFIYHNMGTITFDTCGSSYDTYAKIYDENGYYIDGWYVN